MNLMVVLIPLLLSVAKLTELALLEYKPPAEATDAGGGGGDDDEGNDEEQRINLDLLINLHENDVIQISMYKKLDLGEHFYEIQPSPAGGYDFNALNDSLFSIKSREVGEATGVDSAFNEDTNRWETFSTYKVEDGRQVSITALSETPFQTIVYTMDVCRYKLGDKSTELFPMTMLKQFQ